MHVRVPRTPSRPSRFRFPTRAGGSEAAVVAGALRDALQDVEWDYGTNLAYLKRLVDYWRDKSTGGAQEKKLNEWDQFKTNIDGSTFTSFISGRRTRMRCAAAPQRVPSSIVEYMKVIGPAHRSRSPSEDAEDSFHVVIPSCPDTGSRQAAGRGYSPERIARMWVPLMARLGYNAAMPSTAATGGMESPPAWRSTIRPT